MPADCECQRCDRQPGVALSREGGQHLDIITLSIGLALLVYHGARAVRVARKSSCCSWPAPTTTLEAPEQVTEHGSGGPVQDDVEQQRQRQVRAVSRTVEERRSERARGAARLAANIFPVYLFVRVVSQIVALRTESSFYKEDHLLWRHIHLLYITSLAAAFDAMPWCMKPRVLDVAYIVQMMVVFVPMCLHNYSAIYLLRISTWISCARLLGAVLCGVNARLVAVVNGIYTVAVMIVLYINLGLEEAWQNHGIDQVVVLITIVTICSYIESSMLAEVKSAVEARTSSQAETTIHSLLSGMCDAVVYIGQSLQIQRPAPRLASLLLMRNTAGHLQGSRITEFMPEADRERFQEIAEDRKTKTRSLNVHLRDEYGSLVGVRLFLARCPANEDGEDCQLLGVSVDEEPGFDHVPEPLEPQNAGLVSARMHQLVAQRATSVASRSCRSAQHRSSCSHASDESLALHDADNAEASVWIDPNDVTMTVVACTVGFTMVCGPAAAGGFSLLKAVANTDIFLGWFQHSFNAKLLEQVYEADLDAQQMAPEPLDMILLPHKSIPRLIGMSATCDLSELVEVDGKMVVKLDFDNLSQVEVVRKRKEKKPKGRVRDAHADELPRPSQATTSAAPLLVSL